MATPTFNASVDFFALASNAALKLVSSNENRSIQTASGTNTFGDSAAVDSYGLSAAPSCEYEVIGTIQHTNAAPIFKLGDVVTTPGIVLSGDTASPLVIGTMTINTQSGSAPRITVNGQAVQASASAPLRTYVMPRFRLTARHRAQDMIYGSSVSETLCTIKKGSSAADPQVDYGLDSVNATFPVEFSLAQPKGELANYDIRGGTATVDYSMNWFADTPPTIEVMSSITVGSGQSTFTVVPVMTTPVGKSNPENGYTQYPWQVSFPLIGYEGAHTPIQTTSS